MERVRRSTGVFVLAPGPVVLFFREAKTLLADLRRMDAEERNRASFYTVAGDGESASVQGETRNVGGV